MFSLRDKRRHKINVVQAGIVRMFVNASGGVEALQVSI